MLYRVRASKDNFITNLLVTGRRVISSNAGASEVLELFKISSSIPPSGAIGNILIAFTPTAGLAAYSASYTGSAPEWHLIMRNIETSSPGIGSCDIEVLPVETTWDEGKGHDIDYWTDAGTSNWTKATVSTPWAQVGARPLSYTASASFHFDDGHEDLDVTLSEELALSASVGLWLGVSSTLVADSNDYYKKTFRSRQTHFQEYAPVLELRWADFTGTAVSSSIANATGALVGNIYNLNSVYDRSQNPILRTYLRPKDWNMAVVTTASTDTTGTVLTNAYYRVVEDVSDEVVVPFGTGAVPYTKMSYDQNGNYFQFYMSNLVPGLVYRFDLGYWDSAGEWHVMLGDDMKFRVI